MGSLEACGEVGEEQPNYLILWVVSKQYLSPIDLRHDIADLADGWSVVFFLLFHTGPSSSCAKLSESLKIISCIRWFLLKNGKLGTKEFIHIKSLGNFGELKS